MVSMSLDEALYSRAIARMVRKSRDEYVQKIKQLQERIIDSLEVGDAGFTVHTRGALSPGCAACKGGTGYAYS